METLQKRKIAITKRRDILFYQSMDKKGSLITNNNLRFDRPAKIFYMELLFLKKFIVFRTTQVETRFAYRNERVETLVLFGARAR